MASDALVELIAEHFGWEIEERDDGAVRIVCPGGDRDYGDAADILIDLDEQVEAHLADVIEAHYAERLAEARWEGVNDQWKARPIGHRLIETANPYRKDDDRG
jgi:hypothetical protein